MTLPSAAQSNQAQRVIIEGHPDGNVTWFAHTPPSQLAAVAWGNPTNPFPQPLSIYFKELSVEPAFAEIYHLVERLAAHGGVGDWWTNRATDYQLRLPCIGVAEHLYKPPVIQASTPLWDLSTFPSERYAARNLADLAMEDMDAWVWERLKTDVNSALANRKWASVAIHAEVGTQLDQAWASWQPVIGATATTRRVFLMQMLALARRKGHLYVEGRLRLGPHTRALLLRGIMVGLAATAVWPDLEPFVGDPQGSNLKVPDPDGHVIALETDQGKALLYEPPDLEHEPPLVLLAGFPDQAGGSALRRLRERLTGRKRIRIGTPLPLSVIPAGDEFKTSLSSGLDALRKQLRSQLPDEELAELRRQLGER